MNCERCQQLIDDYVDGTLPAAERGGLEAHLVDCATCRAMEHDFRAIRLTARTLERRVPPAQVWNHIAEAVDAERPPASHKRLAFLRPLTSHVGAIVRSSTASGTRSALAIAATLVLGLGVASWLAWNQISQPGPAAPRASAPAAAADPELAQSVEHELKLAEEHYQKAIAGLEQITRTESSALDPQVATVLQKNLEVIDQAIGESRAALRTQPTSDVAQESLFEALRNKVALLQDTVVLINEMRKGNQEGTARIVSGLNK
jgi:anti-sigma factor RsiW